MKSNPLRRAVAEGRTCPALWIQSGSPALAEASAAAGWPFVLIDNEHGLSDLEVAVHMMRGIEAEGAHPIVRVPSNDPVYLKRILDAGALSVMIPMVSDKSAAEAAAAACRYPPTGERGYAAPIARASRYGMDTDYCARANDEVFVIVQIETADAVERIPEIAAVPGIDMLFIGPNDLAGSIGLLENLDKPALQDLMRAAEERIRASGKAMGTIPIPGRDAVSMAQSGHSLVVGPSDIMLYVQACQAALKGMS